MTMLGIGSSKMPVIIIGFWGGGVSFTFYLICDVWTNNLKYILTLSDFENYNYIVFKYVLYDIYLYCQTHKNTRIHVLLRVSTK